MSLSVVRNLVALTVLLALCGWGWMLDSDDSWLYLPARVGIFWLIVEILMRYSRAISTEIIAFHRLVVAWLFLIVIVKVSFDAVVLAGLVDPSFKPVLDRTKAVVFGVGMALWGNYLPKLQSPWSLMDEPFDWHGVHRFVGLLAFLGGVGVVLLAMAFPTETTRPGIVAIIVTVTLFALGRKFISFFSHASGQESS